jgi:aldose 1-epimerase
MNISRQVFGSMPDGREVGLYKLTNDQGAEVSITNYGGAITSIMVPDRQGVLGDVVLGYDSLADYVRNPRYLGCLVGRHANRLGLGKFSLNGVDYQLIQNNGANHLHGGPQGFDKKVWQATEKVINGHPALGLEYLSVDGEENYPGNLTVNVEYLLSANNELCVEYRAVTDQDTIVNLTNHSYFNLGSGDTILDHQLTLNAASFTPVSKELIPNGEIRSVSGTPMDFTTPHAIGERIKDEYEQLSFTGGYDHNYVLDNFNGQLRVVSTVLEPGSGRMLQVATTQPGMQFYSGNFLNGSLVGKRGVAYHKYAGFCLETQHFPDSPNHPNFPTTVLRAGESYEQTTIFRFTTDRD